MLRESRSSHGNRVKFDVVQKHIGVLYTAPIDANSRSAKRVVCKVDKQLVYMYNSLGVKLILWHKRELVQGAAVFVLLQDSVPVFVGTTRNAAQRARIHHPFPTKQHNVKLVVKAVLQSEEDAKRVERKLIELYRAKGFSLLNKHSTTPSAYYVPATKEEKALRAAVQQQVTEGARMCEVYK